jgi:nucleoside-diphosphate-sugar epimerase
MRIAITGATGFIGAHLASRLTEAGHRVTALVRQPAAIPNMRLHGVSAVRGDVGDETSLDALMAGAEIVFHLARAKAHGTRPKEAFTVNVDGTRAAARAAMRAGVRRFVYASSSGVYGSRSGLVSESSPVNPDAAYARSKARAESVVAAECGSAGVIARITAVMGPGCRSWIPLFKSAAGGTLRLAGDGSNKHHPADVSDIVDGLMRCGFTAGAAGRTYNLAGPEPLPISELRRIMTEAAADGPVEQPRPYSPRLLSLYYHTGRILDSTFGLRVPLIESVAFLTANRVLDLTRAGAELGYYPKTGVSSAVRRTTDWLRSQELL